MSNSVTHENTSLSPDEAIQKWGQLFDLLIRIDQKNEKKERLTSLEGGK